MTERTGATSIDVDLTGTASDVVEAVWAEALGLDAVDPDAGFFDIGATSSMLLGVVRTLRGRWPQLRIVDIFNNPTAARLAAFLNDV